jgi:hypothetical protein
VLVASGAAAVACLALAAQVGGVRPAAASSDEPVIAAAGDIACASSAATATTCRQQATAQLLSQGSYDAILLLGDNQYEDGRLVDYQHYFGPTWGQWNSIIHPVPGNHEYQTSDAAGYFDYFGAAAGDRTRGYYSFDLGAWHIVALNSNCAAIGGCQVGSPQETWLRSDLAAHPTRCTLAYWHHPRFTSGWNGNADFMQDIWTALYAYRADVVLNGHEHSYERFAPQTPVGDVSPYGIREFVVGTGGKSHYSLAPAIPNSVVRDTTSFGILQLSLHPTGYDWVFLPEDGSSFTDAGSAECIPKPAFSLSADPIGDTAPVPGGSATYSLGVDPKGGFSGPVTFEIRDLPAGATASFDPAAVDGSAEATSTLTITTTSSTPGGAWTPRVIARGGSVIRRRSVSVNVRDFSLSIRPATRRARAGHEASFSVHVTTWGGFDDEIHLALRSGPPGAKVSFRPAPSPHASILVLHLPRTTPAGRYGIAVVGRALGMHRMARASLTVRRG